MEYVYNEHWIGKENKNIQNTKSYVGRFLADAEDFSTENLKRANIEVQYENIQFDECMKRIKAMIKEQIEKTN